MKRSPRLTRAQHRKALQTVQQLANDKADKDARDLFNLILVSMIEHGLGNCTTRTTVRIYNAALAVAREGKWQQRKPTGGAA